MDLISILMSRDGLTKAEALKEVFRVREDVFNALERGEYPMDICYDEFGLEPDFIFEVTPMPYEITECEVCDTAWFNIYLANEAHKRKYGYGLDLPEVFKTHSCKSCVLVNELSHHIGKEVVEEKRKEIVKLLKQRAWDYKSIAKELFDITL